jgi:thioredoxin-related protein|tara:strand:+ start:795 stop:1082 length:288 start_codon:yes stop_codon:yes gene_type:complete
MSNNFYLFSKKSCGPCALVDKYFKSIKVDTSMIQYVDLEDFGSTPSQEALDLAKQYNVTATPVLIVSSPNGTLLESKTGGLQITQNIKKLLEQYA